MTLADGKRKVYMLLDEYSSGGTVTPDPDIEAKMADLFDIAQKQVAEVKKIRKCITLERVSGQTEYAMPADFMQLAAIWRGGVKTQRYRWKGGKIIIPADETATIEIDYYAVPADIDPDTADAYEFELPEDACKALPYFVAANQLVADLVLDYGALWQMYNSMLATMVTAEPGAGHVVNGLFRRG